MVSSATIITCVITLLTCTLLPIAVIAIFSIKNKGQKLIRAWILGVAGFFVTQILIRLPILTALQATDWFLTFSQNHLFLYAFSLAFTAGLFELAGRFAVAKLMQKNLTFKRSLAAGLGHGGIEAIVLIGSAYISNLAFIVMINTGTFDTLVAEAAALGAGEQIIAIRDSLVNSHPALFLLAGFERILTMTAHAAMTMIVSYGVYRKKTMQGALLCLGIHTLLDLTAGISLMAGNGLSQTAVYLIIYAILIIAALASVFILRKIHSCWPEKEVSL